MGKFAACVCVCLRCLNPAPPVQTDVCLDKVSGSRLREVEGLPEHTSKHCSSIGAKTDLTQPQQSQPTEE